MWSPFSTSVPLFCSHQPTLYFCYATPGFICSTWTYALMVYVGIKLMPNVKCIQISGLHSLVFDLCLTIYLKSRLRDNRGVQDAQKNGERKGREGVSMKDLLLGGLSWCNTSTSRHHGNPASAPTHCGEKYLVSVLVCYSKVSVCVHNQSKYRWLHT